MKKIGFLFIILMIFSLVSCSLIPNNKPNSSNEDEKTNNNGNNPTENNEPENLNLKLSDPNFNYKTINSIDEVTMNDLFDLHNQVNIEIDIDKSELQKIQDDNNIGDKPEIYRLAKKVKITLTTRENKAFSWEFENVGIRQKGNLSRDDIFIDDNVNTENHYKLSFDETFDDKEMYDQEFINQYGTNNYKDREFLGLSGLDFKWDRNKDYTHLKEIYASYLYRAAGIMVQHIGLTTVKINCNNKTADFGLCYLFEPSSKSFIKRSLDSKDEYLNMDKWNVEKKGSYGLAGSKYGDLYKVTYGNGNGANSGGDMSLSSVSGYRIGLKTDIYGNNYPAYERKTNKEGDDSALKNIFNIINTKNYDEIEKVVDLEYLAIEEAVSYFVGNPDSMRYNYNNYLLYIRRTDGKMIIIPMDNDRAFGIGNTWEDGLRFIYSNDRTIYDKKDFSNNQNRNKLLTKTILSSVDNECKKLYTDYINLLSQSSWLKNDTFVAYYNIIKETYNGLANFKLSNDSNVSFEDFIKLKKAVVNNDLSTEIPDIETSAIKIKDINNLYVVGSFNNWGNYRSSDLEKYKFNPTDNPNIYTVTFTVQNYNGSPVEIKMNGGFNDYSTNDYSFTNENGIIKLVSRGKNYVIEEARLNSTITITINLKESTATIEVKK